MQTAQSRAVGVLGAGRMGLPIIGHLVAAGFPVVVYDVDPGKRETVAEAGAGELLSLRRARSTARSAGCSNRAATNSTSTDSDAAPPDFANRSSF
jgi:3-hydroxyacyl-CoA dehydrogenase